MKFIGALFFLIFYAEITTAGVSMFVAGRRITLDTDTVVHKRSISVGASYGTDASFFGRTGPFKFPYLTADAIYNFKSGFFAYGSAWKVIGSIPAVDELDAGGGYSYTPTTTFSGSVSYTRFIFNKDAEIIKSSSSNDINFNNAYDFKLVKASVVLDYLFGQSTDFFTTFSLSKYIEPSWGVFDDKDYLTFNPRVSMIIGTQNFVSKYAEAHYYTLDFQNIFVSNPNYHVSGPDYAGRNSQLNVLNYSFKLPVAYNRPHYTFEAAYKYSIPVNVEGPLHNHKEGFFSLTFYYLFY
jgi:hypothetical protein